MDGHVRVARRHARAAVAGGAKVTTTRFWISWEQPGDDYRPLMVPPRESVVGYWCSGGGLHSNNMCAVVNANTEEHAKNLILVYWPDAGRWRFCDEKTPDWIPGDRFPPTTSGNAKENP